MVDRKNSRKQGRFSPTMRSKMRRISAKSASAVLVAYSIHRARNQAPVILDALKNRKYSHKSGSTKRASTMFCEHQSYVLTRDGYLCNMCQRKSKDQRLEVHHLTFRSQNGAMRKRTCAPSVRPPRRLHAGTITLKHTGKKKGTLRHATR